MKVHVDARLDGSAEETQAAVGEPVIDRQVQGGVPRQDLTRFDGFIALAGDIGCDLFEHHRDRTVNGRQFGVNIGRVPFGVGARHELEMVGGQGSTKREGPVDRLPLVGHGPDGGRGLLVEEQGRRVVHRQGGGHRVPRQAQPVRVRIKTTEGIGGVQCENVGAVLGGPLVVRDDADGRRSRLHGGRRGRLERG